MAETITLPVHKIPAGWFFVNLFHNPNIGLYHCRLRRGRHPGDPEVTGTGATAEIGMLNAIGNIVQSPYGDAHLVSKDTMA